MTHTRNRRSAKAAGTRFERDIADYLARYVDDRIDRRARTGAKDRGDIGGLRTPGVVGGRIVAECKNTTRVELAKWAAETELERGNDDAVAGLIVHKRKGVTNPGQQWVTCTVDDLVALLTGHRPQDDDAAADEWVQRMAQLPAAKVRALLVDAGWWPADKPFVAPEVPA
ncbi:hypothetical protein SAMN05216215_108735 [Saccharopolyspora shandongensis]|uniref:Uncharacterized protein n=1 Tax=Saccharopolyspora shandongensis TaxID=418495 RepID=A0A1H3TNV0_9PSEU|nr:hypothetical protein [Saccharopolyspora shandongensis]SDZ51491.1 hypothetical protein SAMN05216215_108735 [Saccharopolyspora shandongensis]